MLRRKLSTFSCSNVLLSTYFERPKSLVFISAEGLNKNIWNNTIKYMADRGYSGLSLDIPNNINNIDEVTDNIHASIQQAKIINPIIISHSISTFISQKYLESYAASALVLINPIPPTNHMKSISKLYEIKNNINNDFIKKYYNILLNNNNDDDNDYNYPYPSFIENIKSNPNVSVNLEQGVCEMQLILTTNDLDMNIIDNNDIKQMKLFHDIDDNNIIILNDQSRIPFYTQPELCQNLIYNFIDKIY
jgi:hypothetical protein